MKNITLILILVSLVIFSCRKKEKEATPATQTPIPDSPYSISTATLYSGIFISQTNTTVSSPTNITVTNGSLAFFSDSLVPYRNTVSSITVTNVSDNNNALTFDPIYVCYMTNILASLKNEVWQVDGTNGIPSFKYTNDSNTPDCSSFNNIPDSISISAGYTFSINNVVNSLSGASYISVGTVFQFFIDKPLNNGNNIITYTTADLGGLTPNSIGLASILLENRKVVTIYGTDFQFVRINRFSKAIKILP
jgi:hypothetical protein